ncbi:MAG TPA: DUF1501 domain-containing protein [Bryobacterales bacterium]|jgi:hypothetical protein|nr:DUF1501 domain-containing protein [Bryobacterales bacterium]
MRHRSILPPLTRREALRQFAAGLGMAGFAAAAARPLPAAPVQGNPWTPKAPHFAPKAKHVIVIFLQGGLSQVDSFDYKPMLDKYDGKPLPYETPRTEFATGNLMRSPFKFKKYGQNGIEVSELFPHMAEIIDEFCIVRSMISDIPNHGPSVLMMNTGSVRVGRPSMGSWVVYGLGTENQNLPGYIVLTAGGGGGGDSFGSAFLPAVYQGTLVPYTQSDPNKQIRYLANAHMNLAQQREQLDLLRDLNQMYVDQLQGAPELEATIQSMEVAFRMQTEAPEVFDTRKESPATLAKYGEDGIGRACVTARRLVEKGVRFVQIVHAGWDHHADIMGHKHTARAVDQPIAALVQDLKDRGLLHDTLVLVTSEFGRTPVLNLGGFRSVHNGRDHNIYGFTILMAGGGARPGTIYGATDDFGFKVAQNPVHVHDLHATILYLLGMDHERLTYQYAGRNFRLTDVEGRVVKDIVA